MIEQAKFTFSPLGKALEKQTMTIEGQERKYVEAVKDVKPAGQQQKPKSIEEIFSKQPENNEIKTKEE